MQVLPPALAALAAYKQCCRCKKNKPIEAYARASSASDGLQSWCRACKAEDHQANRVTRGKRSAELSAANVERAKATKRKCYLAHRDRYAREAAARYLKNREKILAQAKARLSLKKQKLKEKYANDPVFRLQRRIASRVRESLRRGYSGRTFAVLGYTVEQLRDHLESLFTEGMSWDRLGEIHVDHIRPISSFNITSPHCAEFKACWALSNLQPLWARDNLRKHAKYRGARA